MSMTYYYSASTCLFYPVPFANEYKDLPDDLVTVDEDVFSDFLSGKQPSGKVRGSDKQGMPCWIDAPEPTQEQVELQVKNTKVSLMKSAESKIKVLERAVKLNMATEDEEKELSIWEKYTVLLNRINPSEYPNINWPDIPIAEVKED